MSTYSHKSLMPEIVMDLVYGSYLQAAPYLHGPDSVTRNLSYAQELFTSLDIDFQRWPRVTVTGSKGKGSTSVLLASILQASGERVGLISSPEMRRFNERIRIDGHCISDEALVATAHMIAPAVQSITSRLIPPQYLGPGGVILALAGMIFGQENISALVVEAGRGGEYDESRLIKANVSVLTPIMLEHADKLGPSVRDIARTKAWITAPGSPIVTAPQTKEVKAVIEHVAATINSRVLSIDDNVHIENVKNDPTGICGDLRFHTQNYNHLFVSLAGRHQIENTATAILAAQTLTLYGVKCTKEGIFLGTGRVRWPGRAQMLQQHPWVLLDGTINRESARHICEIMKDYATKHITAIICVPKPKDLEGVCAQIAPLVNRIVVTEISLPTLTWYDNAATIASHYCAETLSIVEAEKAFQYVMTEARENDGVLLLGTQSFLGAALHYWNADTCNIW